MFILRNDTNSEIIAEQSKCPSVQQIVAAVHSNMTWRCTDKDEFEEFSEVTLEALKNPYYPKAATVLTFADGSKHKFEADARTIGYNLLRYCGMYFAYQETRHGWRYYVETNVYDLTIDL